MLPKSVLLPTSKYITDVAGVKEWIDNFSDWIKKYHADLKSTMDELEDLKITLSAIDAEVALLGHDLNRIINNPIPRKIGEL